MLQAQAFNLTNTVAMRQCIISDLCVANHAYNDHLDYCFRVRPRAAVPSNRVITLAQQWPIPLKIVAASKVIFIMHSCEGSPIAQVNTDLFVDFSSRAVFSQLTFARKKLFVITFDNASSNGTLVEIADVGR